MSATQYVRITELREHELQADLSPWMSEKKWTTFFDGIAADGILQPIVSLPDGRVIDGKHRLRAARELGLAEVRVIYEDISEESVASYIEKTKLERDDLTKGQRACIVLNSDEARRIAEESRKRQCQTLGGYRWLAEESEVAELPQLKTREVLGKKAGISGRNMQNLMEIKRKRPDLYLRIFNGYDESGREVRIGTVYAEMKRDEAIAAGIPPEEKRKKHDERIAEINAEVRAVEESAPNTDASVDLPDTDSAVISARKYVFDATTAMVSTYRLVGSAGEDARKAYLTQLESFVEGAIILLDRYTDDSDKSAMLSLCLEVFKKAKESNKTEEE